MPSEVRSQNPWKWQVREDAVEPAGQPPVGVAEQVHHGRHQHGAQDERVEGDCHG
jgi:hypothetical protein